MAEEIKYIKTQLNQRTESGYNILYPQTVASQVITSNDAQFVSAADKLLWNEMAAKGLFYAGKYTVGTDYPKNAIVEHEGKYYFSLLPTSAVPNVNFSGGALADGKWQALTYEAYYADKAAQADNALKLNGKEESALEVAKAAQADNAAKEAYNCGDSCSDDNLSRLQFVSSYITRNPPKELHIEPCDTISEWDKEEFPMPIELFYFQKQLNCTEDNCNEQSNDVVLSLYNTAENIFSNAKALKNKHDLEIVLTLLLNDIKTSEYSQAMNVSDASQFIGVFSDLLHTSLFNETIYQSYNVDSILYGNNDEDAGYLKLLSQGGFYDNFKPNMAHTTGFNIYLNKTDLTNDNELSEYDTYTIQTTQNNSNTNNILRRITLINDVPILNIKKKEYSNVDHAFIDINAPLYNFAKINENSMWMSDGYQFPTDKNRIYYLDEMSSRVFEFNYTEEITYGDSSCRKYKLNTYNLVQGLYERDENKQFAQATQRFNKPIVVSPVNDEASKDENYFCVDSYSQMVVKANLKLLYSLHTGEYNYFNSH